MLNQNKRFGFCKRDLQFSNVKMEDRQMKDKDKVNPGTLACYAVAIFIWLFKISVFYSLRNKNKNKQNP